MTVYAVTQKGSDDLTDAMRFGDIKYVNHRYIYGDELQASGELPAEFTRHMDRCADEFDPDEDFLAIVGDHLQLVAFSATLAARYRQFRVLRWDRIQKAYFPAQIVCETMPKSAPTNWPGM